MRPLARLSMANLAGPLTAVVVSPVLARNLGVGGRGIYAALTMPILMLGIVGTLGTQDGLAYFIAQRGLGARRALRYLGVILPIASAATMSLGLLVGWVLLRHAPTHVFEWYCILLFILPLQIAFNIALGVATGSADVRAVTRARVFPALLRAVVIVVLCAVMRVSPILAALVLLTSVGVGLVIIVVRAFRSDAAGPTSGDVGRASLLKFSFAALPGVLAGVSTARLDQIVGLPLIGAHQLGLYAVAVSLAEVPMAAATAARTHLLGQPTNAADLHARRELIRRVVGVVAVGSAALAVAAWLLIPAVFGQGFSSAVAPTVILFGATVIYTIGTCLSAVLLSLGSAGVQSRALLVGALVSVAALIGLRSLGATGAALASVIGYLCTAVMCFLPLRAGFGFTVWNTVIPRADDVRWAWTRASTLASAGRARTNPS